MFLQLSLSRFAFGFGSDYCTGGMDGWMGGLTVSNLMYVETAGYRSLGMRRGAVREGKGSGDAREVCSGESSSRREW